MAYQTQTNRKLMLAILAIAAIGCQIILESTRSEKRVRGYQAKRAAVELAGRCFETLRVHRVNQVGDIDLEGPDAAGTGLIGPQTSPISNARSRLSYKRTTINPNFSAIIVDHFQQVGLEAGDPVAVATSGSYPGWNVCLYAAMEALQLRPIITHTVTSSNYGATDPAFTWLDMERVLADQNLISFRTIAASPGGETDMGRKLTPQGQQLIWDAIERNQIQPLQSENLTEAIDRRMQVYNQGSRGQPYKAYVNVGGGRASLGSSLLDVPIQTGLHLDLWKTNFPRPGAMVHLAKQGVPIIQLGSPLSLAREFDLPITPPHMPLPGEGQALGRPAYNPWIALVLLVVYLGATLILIMPGLRERLLGKARA